MRMATAAHLYGVRLCPSFKSDFFSDLRYLIENRLQKSFWKFDKSCLDIRQPFLNLVESVLSLALSFFGPVLPFLGLVLPIPKRETFLIFLAICSTNAAWLRMSSAIASSISDERFTSGQEAKFIIVPRFPP
jgi:hypothetical protein